MNLRRDCYIALTLGIFFSGSLVFDLGANELPNPTLDQAAPIMPANPTDTDKLGFAAASLIWARGDHPIEDYKPLASGKLTSVEWQLLEALRALDTVPDSPSDLLAKGQADRRANIIGEVIKEGQKDVAKGKAKEAVGNAEKTILKTVIQPTVLGDGQGPTRDALRGWITSTLYSYATKGAVNTDPVKRLEAEMKKQIQSGTNPDGAKLTGVANGPNGPDIDRLLRAAEVVRRSMAVESARENAAKVQNIQNHQNELKNTITPQQFQQLREQRSLDRPPLSINTQLKGDKSVTGSITFWQGPSGDD